MMNSISKKCIASFAALLLSSFTFAVETGGLISNDTKLSNIEKEGSLKIDQKNAVNLWLRAPINEDGTSYFITEGLFQTDYDDAVPESDQKLKLTLDLSLFKLVLHKELDSGSVNFSAGRFFNSDLSGIIYTQNGDGAKLEAKISRINISAFAAFTGLLNAKTTTILTEPTPANSSPVLTDKSKEIYVTADKYLVSALTFSLPHIIASQTISLEGFGAFSFESTTFNRIYVTAALNGPIVAPVFYNISSTFSFTKYDESDMKTGNLTKGAITVYPNFKSMAISLNGLYASGKQGSFERFVAFTSGTAVTSTKETEYSSLLKAGLSASIKPVRTLILRAGGDLVFDAAESINYAGIQCSAGFNWQALSDVSLGASFSQYIGKEDYEESIGASKTQIKINAAIAF
ncbi:MAG: hypothetical protein IJ257_04450 [Treponema sp.]|nr:hypothetical protein [Treponema sp.]